MENYSLNSNELLLGQTNISVIGLIAIIIGGYLILRLQKKAFIFTFILLIILFPMAQRVVVLNFNFYLMRIFILIGWLRLIFLSDPKPLEINKLDKLIIIFVIVSSINYTINYGTLAAFANRLGFAYDALGLYLIFRKTITEIEDISDFYNTLAWVSIILMVFVSIEIITQRNLFSFLGGVPEHTDIRDGRLRCQGPFAHSIMLGSFAAALVPIFMFLEVPPDNSLLLRFGSIAAIFITISTGSSGPILSLFSGLAGLCFWVFRQKMRILKYGIFLVCAFLSIYMNDPLSLLHRVKVFGASTGYHRYLLVTSFITNFEEWWLWGTTSTEHWGVEGFWLGDVTNHFIRIAVNGGLIPLLLFIWIIIESFRRLGYAMKNTHQNASKKSEWGFGASLFVHLTAFFGVSYFDQTNVIWWLLIASIASIDIIVKNSEIEIVCATGHK